MANRKASSGLGQSLFATRYSLFARLRAADLAEDGGEFVLDLLSQLGAGARHDREILQPLERPAGVDHGARVGRARLIKERIKRSAPGASDELDVLDRIAARAHRPH